MKIILVFLIITIPVILSLINIRKMQLPNTIRDYFLANRSINESQFIDTSVAYAYQIAALSLFAIWGYEYGFWTILVPFFWGLGFFFIKKVNEKDLLIKFMGDSGENTIHGVLGDRFNRKGIALIASLATLVGLSGTAFFEAEFTSNIIINTITEQKELNADNQSLAFFLFTLFVLTALSYIVIGGYKAVIRTDRIQLVIGFSAFCCFLGITYARVISNGYHVTGGILFALTTVCLAILLLLYPKLKKIDSETFKSNINTPFLISCIIYILSFCLTFIFVDYNANRLDSFEFFISDQKVTEVFVLGFPALISLLIANSLWQFVDVSNWQRIFSLKKSDKSKEKLSASLGFISLYSPVTWIIAIFFGMSLKYIGAGVEESWSSFQTLSNYFFNSSYWFDNFYMMTLILCMIMIMFSTLDSLISSISFTIHKDILSLFSKKKLTIRTARTATILFTILFFLFYLFARTFVSNVDTILYTFYSFQLSLLPSILAVILNKRVNPIASLTSIVIGIVSAIFVLVSLDPYSWAALIVAVTSTLSYILFSVIFNKKNVTT